MESSIQLSLEGEDLVAKITAYQTVLPYSRFLITFTNRACQREQTVVDTTTGADLRQ
jgi:hypothetical protein